jgi:hypothetical protein
MDDNIYEPADDVAIRCYLAYQKKFGKVNMVTYDRGIDVTYLHLEGNDLYIAAANVGKSDKVTPVKVGSDAVLLPAAFHPNIEHVHLLKNRIIKLAIEGHAVCRREWKGVSPRMIENPRSPIAASTQLFVWNDIEWLDVNKLSRMDRSK